MNIRLETYKKIDFEVRKMVNFLVKRNKKINVQKALSSIVLTAVR